MDTLMKSLWTIVVIIMLFPACAVQKKNNKKNFYKSSKKISTTKLIVDGVECEQCAASLIKRVKKVPGVLSADYIPHKDYTSERGELYVEYDPKALMSVELLPQAVIATGFTVVTN